MQDDACFLLTIFRRLDRIWIPIYLQMMVISMKWELLHDSEHVSRGQSWVRLDVMGINPIGYSYHGVMTFLQRCDKYRSHPPQPYHAR